MPHGRKSNRKSGSRRAERTISSPRPRPSFRILAFTLAIPIIAFAAWMTYVFFAADAVDQTEPAVEAAGSEVAAAQVIGTADIVSALQRSGVASNRIVRTRRGVSIETAESAGELARRLATALPADAAVRVRGSSLEITRGAASHHVEVRRIELVDSGAGLVEAEEGDAADRGEAARTDQQSRRAHSPGEKRIALILDDVGFANQPLSAAAALDVPISFAIIPHTPNAVEAARMLNARGFELLCHLPMEPVGFPKVAPGEGAILTSMSAEEIAQQTLVNLRSVPHIRGVNNHMGSRATEDSRVMRSVLGAVRNQNFFFVDSRTSARSVGEKLARELAIKTVARDVFLDDSTNEAAVRAQVRKLAEVAAARGVAVGIGHVYPVTIRVLREEIPRLKAEGYTFVRASEVVN